MVLLWFQHVLPNPYLLAPQPHMGIFPTPKCLEIIFRPPVNPAEVREVTARKSNVWKRKPLREIWAYE